MSSRRSLQTLLLVLAVVPLGCANLQTRPANETRIARRPAFDGLLFGAAYYPEQWPRERWATDAALMQNAGIPTVLFGPLGGNYHAPGEWVSIGETVRAADILEEAVTAYLGLAKG